MTTDDEKKKKLAIIASSGVGATVGVAPFIKRLAAAGMKKSTKAGIAIEAIGSLASYAGAAAYGADHFINKKKGDKKMNELLGQIKESAYHNELEKIAKNIPGMVRLKEKRQDLVSQFVDTDDSASKRIEAAARKAQIDTNLWGGWGSVAGSVRFKRIEDDVLQKKGLVIDGRKIYATPEFAQKNNLKTR